jgi:hypothetical protein
MKRLLLAAVGLAVVIPAAEAAIPSLSYRCTPGGTNDCSGWYRVPVEVTWIYNTGDAEPIDGDCTNWTKKTFSTDTKGLQLTCQVRDPANHSDTASTGTTVHIDRTAPTVTGPGLGRPPDSGDWFNHPVAFGFTGQDATSGIASCTGGTYGGPDGAGVSVTGSCRDVAGNVRDGAFTINYDATPPPDPDVSVLPGNHRVRLTWDSSLYVAEVVRLSNSSAQTVVYRGATGRFIDRRLKNGRRYRYRVTLTDQAGNTSAARTSAVPTSSKLLLPANGAHLTSPPELVWKPVRRASYFNAQLLHRGRKVLTRWPVTNRLQLTERWNSLGTSHRLGRGRYCWYVWPGYGPRHDRHYGRLLGSSCFRITR